MSKKLLHEIKYDGATPEQVYAMLADPEFREQVCEFQRYPKRFVTITPAGAGMTVKVDQLRPATEVPSFARKLVGDELNIVQEETWTSPTSATLEVSVPGKPGDMKGSITLAATPAGTTETVKVEVKVNIPLLGGKIEGFIADILVKALRAETKVGRDWLAARAAG
jgi:hypothetical protein